MKLIILFSVPVLVACTNVEMKRPASGKIMRASVNIPPPVTFSVAEQDPGRKLIRTARLNFQVDNVSDTYDSIKYFMKLFNAYASSEDQELFDSSLRQSMEIRVEETHFDALMAKIESVAKVTDHRHTQTEDVTAEYLDLYARLKTKKELESRYHEILGYARTVKDILSIEEQIGSTRADIESMEGRLKYLTNKVSYGTITLTFYEKPILTSVTFLSRIANSLRYGWQELIRLALLLVSLWPWLLTGAGITIAIKRYWRKRQAKIQPISQGHPGY
jgi:hypothetical protein